MLVVQEGLGQVIAFSTASVYHREIIDVGEKPHEIALTPGREHCVRLEFWPVGSQSPHRNTRHNDLRPGCATRHRAPQVGML